MRALKILKNTFHDQNYRLSLLRYLSKHLVNEGAESLLLGADDEENIASTYSLYDRISALLKVHHVDNAIQIMYENAQTQMPITSSGCCKQACANNYNIIKCGCTIADWYLELHQTSKWRFWHCERGRQSFQAKLPFSENEDLSGSIEILGPS